MIAADHDRRGKLARGDHIIKRKAQFRAIAKPYPADTRGQALKGYALTRHIEPVMQMLVVRQKLFYFFICFIDIFRITRQRRPAERTDTTAEKRTNISRNKPWKTEGIRKTLLRGHLADIIAVVEGWYAHIFKIQHRHDMRRD